MTDQTPEAKGRNKMNKHWQKAADAAKKIAGNDPAGQAAAVAGIQHMYDAIAAAPDAPGRIDAALQAFADNTIALKDGIKATATTPEHGAQMARALLQHTLEYFDEIAFSVKYGHKKD